MGHPVRHPDDLTAGEMMESVLRSGTPIAVASVDATYHFRIGDEVTGFRGHFETPDFEEGIEWIYQTTVIDRD